MNKPYSICCSDRNCDYEIDVPMSKAEAVANTKKYPCTLCGKKTKIYKDRRASKKTVKPVNKLNFRKDANVAGRFFVQIERWERDGTWYNIVHARKKSWIEHTAEPVASFRSKVDAEAMMEKLNRTIGWE